MGRNLKGEEINKFFRGQRNNNPMNIIGGPNRWQGMKGRQEDRNFVQFTTMTYGVRAAMILLTKYHRDYNLKTVPEIVHRWAPDGGEAEKNYITHVRNTLFKSDINQTRADLFKLMQAMCWFESRYNLSQLMFNTALKECPVSVQSYWRK
jgi:hypothetical protein